MMPAAELREWADELEEQLRTRLPEEVDVDGLLPPTIAKHYWTYEAHDVEINGDLIDDDVVPQATSFLQACVAFRDGPEADLLERVYWDGKVFRFVCYPPEQKTTPFEEWWATAGEIRRRKVLLELEKIVSKYHEKGLPFGAASPAKKALAVEENVFRESLHVKVVRFSAIGSGSLLGDRLVLDNLLKAVA